MYAPKVKPYHSGSRRRRRKHALWWPSRRPAAHVDFYLAGANKVKGIQIFHPEIKWHKKQIVHNLIVYIYIFLNEPFQNIQMFKMID